MEKIVVFSAVLFMMNVMAYGQTFTMGKKCNEQNKTGQGLLKAKEYQKALTSYSEMEKSCNTKDAKEAIATGKAEAHNGLGNYKEAIVASDAALKVSKNTSLAGLFQKAYAQSKLGQKEAAAATFASMMALTEKNQNTNARASNYALMSAFQFRQLENTDSANYYLQKAITLDPSNVNFIIQQGDMLAAQNKYDAAFVEYDKAVGMGKADLEMYTIRSSARINMMQKKYKTNNAQELRDKMSAKEKEMVCVELKKAISLGSKDMQLDMFASLVCK